MEPGTFQKPAAITAGLCCCIGLWGAAGLHGEPRARALTDSDGPAYLSPAALEITPDHKLLLIGCATANQVLAYDLGNSAIAFRIDVPGSPLGLAISKDGSRLYAACAGPSSTVCVISPEQRQIVGRIAVGHTAMAPVLSPDGKTLYVCNRFNNDISVIDLMEMRELQRIAVEREPVAAAVTPDGKYLVAANHLHAGRADTLDAIAMVSVIKTAEKRVAKNILLPHGSSLLRGIAMSPDGRFAAVTHLRSMYWLATTGVELGRMNGNAVSIIDMQRLRVVGTVLLDQSGSGAANPWAVAWTPDGATLVVTHAGTHELSLIDAPVEANPWNFFCLRLGDYANYQGKNPDPPRHPVRVRHRVALPGTGPRALVVAGSEIYVANYFSDNICRISLAGPEPEVAALALGPEREPSLVRQGEMAFNDARLCAQGWQSCASCHDADGRIDALNWDLLNDGAGNPKNTRSLLWAHRSGRVMALGVRASAQEAVRAGIHHILFTEQPEETAQAMDAWLKTLEPVPSPYLVDGKLSPAARRGQALFASARTGCAVCHPAPLFTDLAPYDVGTAKTRFSGLWDRAAGDRVADRFYSPPLVELWRTAPYLHDGSVVKLADLMTNSRHGQTAGLGAQEIADLVEYLLSL